MSTEALSDVAKIIMGQSPPSSTYNTTGKGLPFFQGKADFGEMYPTPRVFCSKPNRIAEPGDILMTVRAPVGPTNINVVQSCIGRGLAAIRASKSIDRDYLLYFLRFYEPELAKAGTGSTFAAISRDDLETVKIPLPPLPEQRRIADLLSRGGRLRRLRRVGDELRSSLLQSVFSEMFGDPVTNPMDWDSLEFGEVVQIISGHGFKFSEYSPSGVKLLQIANVSFQEIIWDNLAYLSTEYMDSYSNLVLREGDLLMALNRPILGDRIKFAFLKSQDAPAILYQRVGKFVIDEKRLNPQYLFGFMLTRYFYNELKNRLAGSDQPYINPTELIKMKFLLPPMPLQEQFGAVVRRVEALRGRQAESARQGEGLFQSLLNQSFGMTQ